MRSPKFLAVLTLALTVGLISPSSAQVKIQRRVERADYTTGLPLVVTPLFTLEGTGPCTAQEPNCAQFVPRRGERSVSIWVDDAVWDQVAIYVEQHEQQGRYYCGETDSRSSSMAPPPRSL